MAETGAGRGDVECRSVVPSSCAISEAADGVCIRWLTVATMMQSTWSAAMPAASSACFEAATDIIGTVSSSSAKRRVLMPERCWIHSSLESIASTTSEFGTTRRGR